VVSMAIVSGYQGITRIITRVLLKCFQKGLSVILCTSKAVLHGHKGFSMWFLWFCGWLPERCYAVSSEFICGC